MAPEIEVFVDGRPYIAQEGELAAAFLIRNKLTPLRAHPVDGSPRAPFCMMGVCFECLVEIDERAGVQACLYPLRTGTRIRRPL